MILLLPLLLLTLPRPAPASPWVAQGNPHGDIRVPCAACHTTAGWRPLREPLGFEHAEAGFVLEGGHTGRACADCHRSLEFAHVASACADCHADAHRGEMGFECASCHTSTGWQDRWQIFVLHFTTNFPLRGGHASLDCDACHRAEPPFEFAGTPVDCYACHGTDYRAVQDPDHVAAGLPTDCRACHDIDSWQGATIDHDQAYPLTGEHARVDCAGCHATGFAGTPTDCYACHRQDYEASVEPDHAQLGLPTDCDLCHTPDGWDGAVFPDHDGIWQLTGAHRALDCSQCHADGFADTPTDCYGCHARDYQQTSEPDHRQTGFSTDCEKCHTTRSWLTGEFDHDAFFELRGAHRDLACEACHSQGFAGTPTDCYSCHRLDYEGTTDPDHVAAGLPTDCEACHDQRSWAGAVFDHEVVFPLNGAHQRLECQACHANGYSGTPRDCYGCHVADYDATTDPDHREAGFPTTCEACHDERSWAGAVFDHEVVFPLNGAHQRLECQACHAKGYSGTPRDCYGCHVADYDATTDPDHREAGFPTTCESCHGERAWDDAAFDHASVFELVGAHARLECAACHADGYAGTPRDCYGCHVADYDATQDPDHAAAGFPTTCETCHGQRTWDDATFDHDAIYQLEGAHRSLSCESCHADGYAGTPRDCYACHRAEYNATRDPNHAAAGFPTTCETCHTQRAWEGATFDHDQLYFPIDSGAHREAWNACSDCHVNPGNYAVFECINCHEHSQSEMAEDHDEVSGYQWVSTACYACHPQGRE